MRIVYSRQHLLHDPAHVIMDGRPFGSEDSPERAESILAAIQHARFGLIVSPSDHGTQPILAVHSQDFVTYLQTAYIQNNKLYGIASAVIPETFAPRSARRIPEKFLGLPGYYCYGVGTPVWERTWEAAYWSAQCALTAADFVLAGDQTAYALCRPPGHHAGRDFFGGLCYLNNAAIATRYLQCNGIKKVAILDIDYHHGNGTQEIFYAEPSVLYCSLHAHPDQDYPYYWGTEDETGEGEGLGFNINIPLHQGIEDEAYLEALERGLRKIRDYQPDGLVVSAGFDTAAGDPVGGFNLTPPGVAEVGHRVANLSLPTVILQEGGYQVNQLGMCVIAFVTSFL